MHMFGIICSVCAALYCNRFMRQQNDYYYYYRQSENRHMLDALSLSLSFREIYPTFIVHSRGST